MNAASLVLTYRRVVASAVAALLIGRIAPLSGGAQISRRRCYATSMIPRFAFVNPGL
jgi:hypothetical protein